MAAALLAMGCLVSLASGFFDGGLGHADLEPGMREYQVLLLVVTGLVGLLAAARVAQLSALQRGVLDARRMDLDDLPQTGDLP